MTRKQDSSNKARWKEEFKQLLGEDWDLLKGLIQGLAADVGSRDGEGSAG
jgi:hypothetical protein